MKGWLDYRYVAGWSKNEGFYLLSNWIPKSLSLVAYHFVSVVEQFESKQRAKQTRLTGFIHRQREHVETEQLIRIQVVQLAPPDKCIRTVENISDPAQCSRRVIPIRKGVVRFIRRERECLPLL